MCCVLGRAREVVGAKGLKQLVSYGQSPPGVEVPCFVACNQGGDGDVCDDTVDNRALLLSDRTILQGPHSAGGSPRVFGARLVFAGNQRMEGVERAVVAEPAGRVSFLRRRRRRRGCWRFGGSCVGR